MRKNLRLVLLLLITLFVVTGNIYAKEKNKKEKSTNENVQLSGFLIRGRLPKPQAMYIIHKSSTEIYAANPLEADSKDFSKKIYKTINNKTFKNEEEKKWAGH